MLLLISYAVCLPPQHDFWLFGLQQEPPSLAIFP